MQNQGSIFQLQPSQREYKSPTPGNITLFAMNPTGMDTVISESICSKLKGANFTTLGASISLPHIVESLNNCFAAGLPLFLQNYNLIYYTKNFVTDYTNYPGLGGWLLSRGIRNYNYNYNPEPDGSSCDKEGETPIYDLVNANKIITEMDNHPVFIGMSADWEYNAYGEDCGESFTERVKIIERDFSPTFWPYLYLPDVSLSPGDENELLEREKTYYKNLRYFGYVAQYTATVFWTFVRCRALNNYYGYYGSLPSEETMRGLVFSSLAYGAQGVCYWQLKDVLDNSEMMAKIARINREVLLYNHVFCGCEVMDTRHFCQNRDLGDAVKIMHNAIGPLEEVIPTNNPNNNSVNLLISQIFNDEQNYLVIVASPFINGDQSFQLKFNSYWDIIEFETFENRILNKTLTDYNPTYSLKPGSYLIFRWN